MKKSVLSLIIIFSLSFVYAQSEYRKKYYNDSAKSSTEFYPIGNKEYLSFDSYECNSITINHYKDFEIINSYKYEEEVIHKYSYKRRDNIFLLMALLSAHDYPSYRGPHFINHLNYDLVPGHVEDSYSYSDFTFLTDSTVLAIAKYEFKTRDEVDEWHVLDLDGNIIEKVIVSFPDFIKLHKAKNYLIIADENEVLILNDANDLLSTIQISKTKNIYAIGEYFVGIHTEDNNIKIVELASGVTVFSYKVIHVDAYEKGYIECLDVNGNIISFTAVSNVIVANEVMQVGDEHYKPAKFIKVDDGYLTYGNDAYDYGVSEYRYFSKDFENDTLLDVGISHKITSLKNVVKTTQTPGGPFYTDYTDLEGTFTITNNTNDYIKVSAITQGFGGAYCFTFNDTYVENLAPNEEKTFPLVKSIYGKRTGLNFCIIATSINGKTDADHKDNKSCSYTVATGIKEEKETEVEVFPNPVSDELHIKMEDGLKLATLFDLNGKPVEVFSDKKISTSHLPDGVYILVLIDQQGRKWVKKVVLAK